MTNTSIFLVGGLFLVAACSAGSATSSLGDGGTGDSGAGDAAACGPVDPGHCVCGVKSCVNGAWTCPACAGEGGTTPAPIRASDYNQTCTAYNDCVPVTEGAICGCLGCGGNAAINKSDQSRFSADFAARRAQCPATDEACPALPCALTQAFCNANKCAICHDASCAGLNQGDVCDPASDKCGQGLLCCAQGGHPVDGGASATLCTQPTGTPPACPNFP